MPAGHLANVPLLLLQATASKAAGGERQFASITLGKFAAAAATRHSMPKRVAGPRVGGYVP